MSKAGEPAPANPVFDILRESIALLVEKLGRDEVQRAFALAVGHEAGRLEASEFVASTPERRADVARKSVALAVHLLRGAIGIEAASALSASVLRLGNSPVPNILTVDARKNVRRDPYARTTAVLTTMVAAAVLRHRARGEDADVKSTAVAALKELGVSLEKSGAFEVELAILDASRQHHERDAWDRAKAKLPAEARTAAEVATRLLCGSLSDADHLLLRGTAGAAEAVSALAANSDPADMARVRAQVGTLLAQPGDREIRRKQRGR